MSDTDTALKLSRELELVRHELWEVKQQRDTLLKASEEVIKAKERYIEATYLTVTSLYTAIDKLKRFVTLISNQ